jgi:hypothetical protein
MILMKYNIDGKLIHYKEDGVNDNTLFNYYIKDKCVFREEFYDNKKIKSFSKFKEDVFLYQEFKEGNSWVKVCYLKEEDNFFREYNYPFREYNYPFDIKEECKESLRFYPNPIKQIHTNSEGVYNYSFNIAHENIKSWKNKLQEYL